MGPVGQDRTVPEASLEVPYDAFKFDIYQLGNVIVKQLDIYEDLSSLKPLADAMTRPDPDQRPSATEAYELLVDTILNLSEDQLNHQRIWKTRTPAELRHRVEFCNENPLEYN
ncbi:unnamed protein product [Cyclocybe aegerita]|uniref:Protein kinase domain-containing protein n=1 Tax=Cyclocybe aegerita TaxID=1973307 RepID=A0A8S0WI43_CYCAE|nr:unnamed protein product [Cyclocybe aegerita]